MDDFFLFVSHVSEDRPAAMQIVNELARRGVRCWIGPRDVRPGKRFDDEIASAIENCRAMLLIFSNHCNARDQYILREITIADDRGKLIIPFRIEDAEPKKGLSVRLANLHRIDAFVAREKAIDEIVRTVQMTPDNTQMLLQDDRSDRGQTLVEALWLERGKFNAVALNTLTIAALLVFYILQRTAEDVDSGQLLNIVWSMLVLIVAASFRMRQTFLILFLCDVGVMIIDIVHGSFVLVETVSRLSDFVVAAIVGMITAGRRPRSLGVLVVTFMAASLIHHYAFLAAGMIYFGPSGFSYINFVFSFLKALVAAVGAATIIWVAWQHADTPRKV